MANKSLLTYFKSLSNIRERIYDGSVDLTLRFYERYMLPQGWWHGMGPEGRVSIKELKIREFRDRKKLLNPYQKEQLIA
jgi:hypothetical protein